MALEHLSILLVEDDPDLRARTLEMLAALGVRDVVALESVPRALDELARRPFTLLLSAQRPGIERGLLRKARRLAPATRTILMSSNTPATRLVARTLGVAEVLAKPFSLPVLELSLQRAQSAAEEVYFELEPSPLDSVAVSTEVEMPFDLSRRLTRSRVRPEPRQRRALLGASAAAFIALSLFGLYWSSLARPGAVPPSETRVVTHLLPAPTPAAPEHDAGASPHSLPAATGSAGMPAATTGPKLPHPRLLSP